MHALTLAAGALAAALMVGGTSAQAADLDYGRVPTDRYSAYDDPRYRDIYGPPPGAVVPYQPPPRYYSTAPVPPAPVYRDRDYDRYADPRDRYADPRDRYDRYDDDRTAAGCLPREEIRRRLVNDGWRDFRDLELRGDVARIRARRPSGDLYALRVERCTGEIVASELIERGAGPFAYDDRPTRPYY